MNDLLIVHGVLLTSDERDAILEDSALVISGQYITDIGPFDQVAPKYPEMEQIDASGMVVMPGLVNTHTHLSMTMTRSIADDIEAKQWLPIIWAVENHLTEESIYTGALLGIAEMIASGTTCFNDQYFYMEQVAKAVSESGIRAELAEGIIENRDRKRGQRKLQLARAFAEEWHGKANGRIRTRISPHALYTCSTDLVVQAREVANELGIGMHMHIAESALEMKIVGKKKLGDTSVQHLDALGVLGPDFIMAHGLTINDQDVEILAERGVGIAHCPQAIAKLGGYPFPTIDKWIKAGINVGLGTDGVASNNNLDLIDEMRFTALAHKLFARDGTVLPARQVIHMATIAGARALGLGDEIGSLEVGKKADIILIDFRKPHLTPCHNIPGHLIYSASGADVDTVIIDGKMVMRNRKFLTLDIDAVIDRAQSEFEALLHRAKWRPTVGEPKAGPAAALRLKITQQSLKVMEILMGEREPDAEETL